MAGKFILTLLERFLIFWSFMEINRNLSLSRHLHLTRSHVLAQVFWIVVFAIMTAIGARIEIPHQPVPFTLQTFFVLLAGAFLGVRNGVLSQFLYLIMGAAGLPVFTIGGMGLAKLLGPTGGYLLSFPVAAFVVGTMIHTIRKSKGSMDFPWVLFSMFIGLLVVFSVGTLQLYLVSVRNLGEAFRMGFLIFSWWDLMKLFAAATIYHRFSRRYKTFPP
ncbi:MAG: biotin transporter BioY [Bacteroidota bacterium]